MKRGHAPETNFSDNLVLTGPGAREQRAVAGKTAVPLRLDRYFPKGVRCLIWRYLNAVDREMIRLADNSLRKLDVGKKYLVRTLDGYEVYSKVLTTVCAWFGHLELLKWAHSRGAVWDEFTCAEAAANGDLAMVQWARAHGAPWNYFHTCVWAIEMGHLHVIQWGRANGALWDLSAICEDAANNGQLHIVQWARANGAPWNEETRQRCAELGYVE